MNLVKAPCPDCDGSGCEVCEQLGHVLIPEKLGGIRAFVGSNVDTGSATARTDASQGSVPTEEGTGESTGDMPEAKALFGGLSASEASRLRWARDRERNAEAEAVAQGSDVIVRTTVPVSTIIKRLSADAQKGNTHAARELRAWLAEVAVESRTSLEDLDERTRQELLARLLYDIEQERVEHLDELPPAESLSGDATPPKLGLRVQEYRGPLQPTETARIPAGSEQSANGAPSQDDTPVL